MNKIISEQSKVLKALAGTKGSVFQGLSDAIINDIKKALDDAIVVLWKGKKVEWTTEAIENAIRSTKEYHEAYRLAFNNAVRKKLPKYNGESIEKIVAMSTDPKTPPNIQREIQKGLQEVATEVSDGLRKELAETFDAQRDVYAQRASTATDQRVITANKNLEVKWAEAKAKVDSGEIGTESLDSMLKMLELSAPQTFDQIQGSLLEKIWYTVFMKDGSVVSIKKGAETAKMVGKTFVFVSVGTITVGLLGLLYKLSKIHTGIDGLIPINKRTKKPLTQEELEGRPGPATGLSTCFQNLINKRMGQLGSKNNVRYVWVKNTQKYKWGSKEYDDVGGLKIFEDGRIISGDGTQESTWDCSFLNESRYSMESLVLNEQPESDADKMFLNIHWKTRTPQKQSVPSVAPQTTQPALQPNSSVINNEFPFQYNQKNERIREIQSALGFDTKNQTGIFDTATQNALKNAGYDLSGGITMDIYNEVLRKFSEQYRQQHPEQQTSTDIQEDVKRIKIMMNYDLSKTRNENIKTLTD